MNASQRPTRQRHVVLLMVFVCVVITYMDRSNISVTASAMHHELGIDTVHMGWVLSAFGWSYAFCQIPGGWLVDRIRPRYFYPVILALWSLATALLGIAGSFVSLFMIRLLIGVLEAPSSIINIQVVTSWFPERERAGAVGFYTSGQFIGLAFLQPLLLWLMAAHGMRSVFFASGIVGLLWGLVWLAAFRTPRESRHVNAHEIAYLEAGGALVDLGSAAFQKARTKLNLADLHTVFRYRKLWGVYIGQFAITSSQWFFLTWFPTYLVESGTSVSSSPASMSRFLSSPPLSASNCRALSLTECCAPAAAWDWRASRPSSSGYCSLVVLSGPTSWRRRNW